MITVCVKCAIDEAVSMSDWDEVVRLAQAAKDSGNPEPEPEPEPVKSEPVKSDKS